MNVFRIFNWYKNKKFIISAILIFFLLLIWWWIYILRDQISEKIQIPQTLAFQVQSSNFDTLRWVLPYNATSIDFYFTDEIDESYIDGDNFIISPHVEWYLTLKDSKTLSYHITWEMQVWDYFTITIWWNLRSTSGVSLWWDLIYDIEIIPWSEVIHATPTWDLQNLSQAVHVFFNIPMVPLTNLDIRDTLPCPLKIYPEVSWTCSWITTSVLEFIPDSHFTWATTFNLKVDTTPWLNYVLDDIFEFQITTTDLSVSVANHFNPLDGIIVHSNFPIWEDDLLDALSIFQESKENPLDVMIKKSSNNTRFTLFPSDEVYLYDTHYIVEIQSWLSPRDGNNPLKYEYNSVIRSNSFVHNIRAYSEIRTSTWKLLDTRSFDDVLPNDNVFFNIYFRDEVPLDPSLFSFSSHDTDISFDIAYNTIQNSDWEEEINKKSIRLSLDESLENSLRYILRVHSDANSHLKEDIALDFRTSDVLTLNSFEFIDYMQACIYVNNQLSQEVKNDNFTLTPDAVFRWFRYIYPWQFQNQWSRSNIPCTRDPADGEHVYILDIRLNPHTVYELSAHDISDIYENKISNLFVQEVQTGNIQDRHKFIYSTLSNHVNLFPGDIDKLLNMQTINTDTIYLDICEMNDINYMHYMENRYQENFNLRCNNRISRNLPVINKNWILTSNYFDLEEEILQRDMQHNYVLIHGYASASKSKNNPYFSKIIARSSLSLYLEKASNISILFPTTLPDHNFISDLTLEFYDAYGSKITQRYTYNTETWWYEIESDMSGVRFVRAYNDQYSWVISLIHDELYNYNFWYISWNDSRVKDFLYLYTDKPIYKPWERVNIKWLLRYFDFDGYTASSIQSGDLIITDGNWQELTRFSVDIDNNSNFDTSFLIPEDIALWYFSISFEWKNTAWRTIQLHNVETLHIEEYKAPTFRIAVDDDADSDSLFLGDDIRFTIHPQYYFGGDIINTSGRYTILTQNYFFDAKEYSNYQFGEGYVYFSCIYWGHCNTRDINVWSWDFDIDSSWVGHVSYSFEEEWEKIYSFNFTVQDPDTNREVSTTVSKVIHNTDGYVWLQSRYFNEFDDGIQFDAITLHADASVKPHTQIDFTLVRKEWKQVREKWVDGVFYYSYSLVEEEVETITLTSDAKWEIRHIFQPEKSGQYDIVASYTWSNEKSFISKSSVYLAWEEYVSWRHDNNSITELTPEKTIYTIWETADFTLQSPVNQWRAIFFIEKDDGILDYFVHNIQSYGDKIQVKIQEEHYPNIYLKWYFIGTKPWDILPTYKRALWVVKVLTDHKELSVQVETDQTNYNPRDIVKIYVQVTNKAWESVEGVNWSISVVDESVLALKWNPKRNPFSFFYDMKRYLWVFSYLNLKNLVEKLEVRDVTSWEKWWSWDNQKWGDSEKPRWDFRDVALWEANFETDGDWRATIIIERLPDNLTTWVIETIVNTTADNKIWIDYTTFRTSKDVMIQDHLPRVFATGDKIVIAPVVHNRTWTSQDFEVSIDTSHASISTNSQTVHIEHDSQKRVEFTLHINDANNISELLSRVHIQTQALKDNSSDGIVRHIPIIESKTPEFVSTRWSTQSVSHNETIQLWDTVLNTGANLEIRYGGSLFSHFLAYTDVDNLSFWNSPSLSRKTSVLNPFVQVKKLYNTLDKEYDFKDIKIKRYVNRNIWFEEITLDELITSYILEIGSYQNSDGGFTYFTDSLYRRSDFALSTFVLSSLSEIRDIWYNVPDRILNSWARYLKLTMRNIPTCDGTNWENCMSMTSKISWLNTLLDINNNDYEVYTMMQNLEFNPVSHSTSTRLQYTQLLSKIIHIDTLWESTRDILISESRDMIQYVLSNQLVFNPRWAFIGRSGNHNRSYNTALFLDVISRVWWEHFSNFDDIRDNIIRFLVWEIDSNTQLDMTHTDAFRFIVNYLTRDTSLIETDMRLKLNFNNTLLEERSIHRENIFHSFSQDISIDNIWATSIFNAEKTWTWTLYYDISLSYFLPIEDIHPRDNWFSIIRSYYSYNEYKKIHDAKQREFEKYLSWELAFDELEYTKDVVEYLDVIEKPQVWDLILVYNRLITPAPRDNVEIHAYIPSWTELVNTRLDTEEQGLVGIWSNFWLDREELRHDRYDWFVSQLNTWVYNFSYIIRATHKGQFELRPTIVRELHTPEVFWRNSWELFEIQ